MEMSLWKITDVDVNGLGLTYPTHILAEAEFSCDLYNELQLNLKQVRLMAKEEPEAGLDSSDLLQIACNRTFGCDKWKVVSCADVRF